jgi:hypothetical protein
MTEEEQTQYLQWCFEEILKNVWSDDPDYDRRMANILARANLGYMVLTGTDEMREELFQAFDPAFRANIKNVTLPDWSQK